MRELPDLLDGMIKVTKDGRTILTGQDYSNLREIVYFHQNSRCKKCKKHLFFNQAELDHIKGRGAGKRDDVPSKTQILCHPCHVAKHLGPKPVPKKGLPHGNKET